MFLHNAVYCCMVLRKITILLKKDDRVRDRKWTVPLWCELNFWQTVGHSAITVLFLSYGAIFYSYGANFMKLGHVI